MSIEDLIINSGWTENRIVDISSYVKVLEEEGYEVTDVALAFLKKYGGLNINYENPRIKGTMLCLEINPIDAASSIFRSVSERYEKHCNENFVIIGQIQKEEMTVYISESGAFYGGYDDCLLKLGNTFYETLENLVQGVKLDLIEVEE